MMRARGVFKSSIRAAGLAVFVTALMNAQSGFEAQIRGTVTDPAGALVAGAVVRLTDTATGLETQTTTNDHGLYTLNGLRPGHYNLRVEHAGFAPSETKDIDLSVSQQAVINVGLHL